jgi:hypothetical protein
MRPVRHILLALFVAALVGDLVLGGFLVSQLRYGSGVDEDPAKKLWLVGVRTALTSRFTEDRALLAAPPERLLEAGFRVDPQQEVAAWAEAFLPTVPYLTGVSAATLPADPIERAKHLSLLFSKNGGPGCGHFRDIEATLLGIAEDEGHGCCVDHARALVALGEAYGLVVRTVRHSRHTFNEVWVPALGKWVMIDSQYAVTGSSESGEPLSTLELRERMLEGRPVRWEFFGNQFHKFARRTPESHKYYGQRDSFRDFKVVWGTNFLEQHAFFARLGWLPKAPRELVGRLVGVMPPDLILVDEDAVAATEYGARRTRYLLVLGALGAGTFGAPLLLWLTRERPRPRLQRSPA